MKHNKFADAMQNLETAIDEAYKIAVWEFIEYPKCDEIADEWYRAMKLLEAMTNMKVCIKVNWE